MNYEVQDWEMSFKDMLFYVLYKWKKIALIAVVLALVLGGFQVYSTLQKAKNSEKAAADYQKAMEEYDQDLEILEESIADTEQLIEDQEQYLMESILMQLGPHNAYEAKVNLYVSTDYKIMPNMVYQNVDNVESIMAMYQSVLKNNEIISQVAESVNMEGKYLKELITVSELTDHMLEIAVLHEDGDAAEEILKLLMQHVEEIKPSAIQIIGEHKVDVVLETVGPYVDGDKLSDKREKQEKYLTEYKENLADQGKELEELQKTKPSLNVGNNPIKTGILWGIVGCVVGCVLGAFLFCVVFVFRTTVYSAEELSARIGIKSLGCTTGNKVRFDPITRLLRKIEGRIAGNSDQNIALIAENIRTYCKQEKCLLVTGSGDAAYTQELVRQLQPYLTDMQLISGGCLLRDSETVSDLRSCACVLLVEACGKSHYKTIGQERERIQDAQKKLIGCILIDA